MIKEKKNMLFDILDGIFTNKEYVNGLSYESCKQNIFMINRRIAIKYPLQAQMFNNSSANPKDVVRFWSDFLYSKRTPRWIYTKSVSNETHDDIPEKLLKSFSEYCGISMKDLKYAKKNLYIALKDDIDEYLKFKKLIEK